MQPINDEGILSHQESIVGKYRAIVAERRERFRNLLENKDKHEYDEPRRSAIRYEIQGKTVTVPAVIRRCTKIKDEPTIFYIKTLMPEKPEKVQMIMSQWDEHRSKWDKRIASQVFKRLSYDEKTKEKLSIVDAVTQPYFGGIVSPRQFTSAVHIKWVDSKTLEIVSCSVKCPDFPTKKGHVLGQSILFGHRITEMGETQLQGKYEIPQINVVDPIDGVSRPLKWSKCDGMIQTYINGNIPSTIYDKVVPRAVTETYEIARKYLMRDVMGLNFKIL